ncbi:hypothetical protein [Lysobacter solisilvae (ex Woo and Kim 2020)]|uniref:Uncharacterized protein n=1 Tax=Agrilutibacter terrestris TaxID=2865112 RepID=A0A7H0FXF7_9GAMM|nr:hypothetical protein [Lysobacter terrestris]QNP40723.1 hypothetical protein H8B22_00175 [Lysobacter terrestris]
MSRIAALLVATLLALAASDAVAGGIFCRDPATLSAWKQSLNGGQRRRLDNPRDIHHAVLVAYEGNLASAAQGKLQSKRQLGIWWTLCQMVEGSLGDDRLHMAADYLREGAEENDRQGNTLLAIHAAMGWGLSQSHLQAFELLDAVRSQARIITFTTFDEFKAQASLEGLPEAEQQSAYAYNETLAELLAQRLPHHWQEFARRRSAEEVNIRLTVHTCPATVEVLSTNDTADAGKLTTVLQRVVELVPQVGVPCRDGRGLPLVLPQDLSLWRPEKDPFAQ